MTITDGLHYIAIGNPVSKAIIGTTASLLRGSNAHPSATTVQSSATALTATAAEAIMPPLWKLAGRHYHFVRLAGLSGASAVVLGAIGSHLPQASSDKSDSKMVFDTANRFHFFHSLALLGVPLTKRPVLTGTLMITGTLLFSGILYYRALTGEKRYSRFAPLGGTCLILAWLSMLF